MSMGFDQPREPKRQTQHDGRIDSVLHALRDAQPSHEMQTRLLATLRHAQASETTATAQTGSRWLWPWQTHAASPWLTLAACLLTVVGTLLHRLVTPESRDQQLSGAVSDTSRSPALQRSASTLSVLPADVAMANRRQREIGTPATVTHAQTSVAADTGRIAAFSAGENGVTQLAQVMRQDEEARTIAAARPSHGASAVTSIAASFPPPPLPLTQQERLLAQLMHHERSPQLAALTRSSMEEAATREKNAVEEYFATVPSVQDEQEPPAPDQPSGQP